MNLEERRFNIGISLGGTLAATGIGILATGLISLGLPLIVFGFIILGWGISPWFSAWRAKRSGKTLEPGQIAGTSRQSDHGGIHTLIDEAARFVTTGRPELAIEQLEKIKRTEWDLLSSRERYRVLANLGNARLLHGEKEFAARFYLQAANYQPEDEEASGRPPLFVPV